MGLDETGSRREVPALSFHATLLGGTQHRPDFATGKAKTAGISTPSLVTPTLRSGCS